MIVRTTIGLVCLFVSTLASATIDIPPEAYSFDTNVIKLSMNAAQKRKIRNAEELIKEVIATPEFRHRVLNYKYNGVHAYVDNDGLTNAQVYKKILEGAETLQPAKNNRMDVEVALYFENSNTVGYTTTLSKRINMNTKYFNKYRPINVSRNLMHEWLHKLGFKHAVKYTPSRDHSIPYAVAKIVQDIAKTL
jgi:hypothetical protein